MGRRLQGGEATTAMGPGRGPRSGQAELLGQAKGLPVFRVGFLRSRPGTHLGWRETFRFPGITRLSEPGSPERGPGSCIIVSAVSAGSPVDLRPSRVRGPTLQILLVRGEVGRQKQAQHTGAVSLSIRVPHLPEGLLWARPGHTETGRTGVAGE